MNVNKHRKLFSIFLQLPPYLNILHYHFDMLPERDISPIGEVVKQGPGGRN